MLDKLAEEQNVGVSQEEFTQLILQKAQQNGTTPEQELQHMSEHNHMPEWMGEVRRGKALNTIVDEAVVTDNGACYRSRVFSQVLDDAKIGHKWTRPYRPQTNGKVERFNRSLAAEWAYARDYTSETEREAAYTEWLHHYNHHRPHTGIGGQTPSERVHNLTGKYT